MNSSNLPAKLKRYNSQLILCICCILASQSLKAQQEPMYSQYMFNMLQVNPAYAGNRAVDNITAVYRNQWMGINGAPKTGTISWDRRQEDSNIGYGLQIYNDRLGIEKTTGIQAFYKQTGMRYVSTHPMFGPTFANLSDLSTQSAIIIAESDHLGKAFFKDFYGSLQLNIFEYTFDEHDETIAYSLSIPFVSSLVFAAVMKHQEAPGTTFKKHLNVARGLLSEDDYLLSEILFNPHTAGQIEAIKTQMTELQDIVEQKDLVRMQQFLTKVRTNIE